MLCVEEAVKVYIQNWRCVDELKLSLGRINVFIGPNASGKSSVAYAVYLAARTPQNPAAFVTQLYGYGFDKLAKNVGGRAQYPVVIRLDDAEIRVEEGGKLTTSPRGAGEAYLLPARRLAYLQIMLTIHKAMGEVMKRPETVWVAGFVSFFAEVLKSLPAAPPLPVFISDYLRAVAGIDIEPQMGGVSGVGAFMLKTAPVFSLLEFTYRDPYVELELPLDLAPEGFIDFVILDTLARRMPRRALVVVEEPEIHKNPLKVMEYVERLVKIIEEKDVTVVMTTHSDLVVLTLAKLVAQRRLRADDVKVYYFTRDPWTRAEEVKIFPDGTVEKLPDWEEATAALF
jgi:hypothetical protein